MVWKVENILWAAVHRRLERQLWADRKATATKKNHLLQQMYVEEHLWTYNVLNIEADCPQQQNTTLGGIIVS